MARRIWNVLLVLAALLVVLTAAVPGGAIWLLILFPPRPEATVALAVGTPIRLNQDVPITITVHTNRDIRQMDVALWFSSPRDPMRVDDVWRPGDVPAGRTLQFNSSVVFPAEAEYELQAAVHNIEGMHYSTQQTD